ncbi:hypothetical protein PaG_04562 [Moesziomyces aphidis]|uniref:TAFII28-like protein domain-containing protein n=1 Tax=Moesziomyces aphidis TaxID=84754 RepID=W3VIU4_MOEAP|nr:hypothetical protein PaG_04562 [Moesziomyces aphidis]
MSGSQPPQGANMPGMDMPNFTGEGVIPASFFDMPLEFGGGAGDGGQYYQPMSGFPMGELPMSQASDFDALQAQIAASVPPMPTAANPGFIPPINAAMSSSHPLSVVKMETDEPTSAAGSSPMTAGPSTPKPAAPKSKKAPAKPKTESGETKPKKPKKKAAAADGAESSKGEEAQAASPAPVKPKKPSKKKKADNKDAPASAAASPAPFITPVSPAKDAKLKGKKASGGAKAGAKSAGKQRSSTARSVSRMSSVGREANTPGASRTASQRPADAENNDEEEAPREAPPGEDDAEDEEVEADDGVEELGKDHFSTQEAIYAAQQRNMGLLSMVMDEDQLDRHMASRRGALNKASVRKLVNHVLSQSVSQHVAMVVSGVAKIFVGEIIEKGKHRGHPHQHVTVVHSELTSLFSGATAREIQAARDESGPLRPNHLREAHRQYYLQRERPGHYPPGTTAGFPGLGKRRRMF